MPHDLTEALIRERIAARRRVREISRRIMRNELHIARDATAVAAVDDLEKELELACRDLVNLVDDSPPRTWPHGWERAAS